MNLKQVQLLTATDKIQHGLKVRNFKPLLCALKAYEIATINENVINQIAHHLKLYSKYSIHRSYLIDKLSVEATAYGGRRTHGITQASKQEQISSFCGLESAEAWFKNYPVSQLIITLTAYPTQMKIKQAITHHFVVFLQ